MSEPRVLRSPEFVAIALLLMFAGAYWLPLSAALPTIAANAAEVSSEVSSGVTVATAENSAAVTPQDTGSSGLAKSVANNPATGLSNRQGRTAIEKSAAKPNIASNNSRISISGVEKLIIRVEGYTSISGEHRVSENSSLLVAGLGWVSVKDKSLGEIEQLLSSELQKLTGRDANVSVEVAEFKPIFVSGYVTRAGSFPWRPGYTVLHAETLSGGVYRPTSATGAALPSDTEKARAHRAASDLANVEVTIARLNAERAGAKEIERPARLKDLVSDVDADRLIAAQGTALASRRAAHDAQVQGLERARALAQEEYQELRNQHVRLQEQLRARQDNLNKLDGLKEKGYLRAERILDEQARVADLEARTSNSSVALARVKSLLGTFQRDLDVIRQDRIAQIDAETIKQEREASQLEIEVQSAAQSYRKLTGTNAFNESQSSKQSMVGYEIVRQKDGQPVAVSASRFTLLEPGDVLVVSLVDQFNN